MINRKRIVLWLLLGGSPPLILSLIGFMLIIVLVIFVIAFTSALFSPAQYGGQASTLPQTTITSTWSGETNAAVVSAAFQLANQLYNCGDENHTQCYHSMPPSLIDYWSSICHTGSECWSYWQSGDFQCVTFITGAYHLAQQDIPAAPNAVDFWTDPAFSQANGWEHISANSIPWPGDIIVLSGPTPYAAGHVAIVVNVQLPTLTAPGFVQFAQGNAVDRIATQPFIKKPGGYSLQIWTHYTILGYLRNTKGYNK